MKILIIGGTIFYGRHLTQAAIDRGHEVTLFNRGRHSPELFPEAEKIHGDRDGDLGLLEAKNFDAVIDTCGQVPRLVRESVDALKASVDHYTFISSISVFSDFSRKGMDESGPLGQLEDDSIEQVTHETYGPMKARCEQIVLEGMPGHGLVIRPGLIVGPFDWTDRFSYWPIRVERGGAMVAPQGPDVPVQFIDARDLADWTLDMVESGATGTFNATGPAEPTTLGQVIDTARAITGSDVEVVWTPEEVLRRHNVQPWMEMPMWVGGDAEAAGLNYIDCSKAIATGLAFRPLVDTVRDTLEWYHSMPERELNAGLKPEKEKEVVESMKDEGAESMKDEV